MPKRVPPLTQLQIKNAKPRDKPYKLADGGGLYLEVTPVGGKHWRMKYRQPNGKENKLHFGAFPAVSLLDARERRDSARQLLAAGADPARVRDEQARYGDEFVAFVGRARPAHKTEDALDPAANDEVNRRPEMFRRSAVQLEVLRIEWWREQLHWQRVVDIGLHQKSIERRRGLDQCAAFSFEVNIGSPPHNGGKRGVRPPKRTLAARTPIKVLVNLPAQLVDAVEAGGARGGPVVPKAPTPVVGGEQAPPLLQRALVAELDWIGKTVQGCQRACRYRRSERPQDAGLEPVPERLVFSILGSGRTGASHRLYVGDAKHGICHGDHLRLGELLPAAMKTF